MSTNDSTPDPMHRYVSTSRDHHFCDVCSMAEDDDRARHLRATPLADDASTPDPTADERACLICRRPEHEHRDRNGHGFAPTLATPPADDASERRWRDPQTGALGPIHDPVCAALSYDDEDSCSCGALDDDASTGASEPLTEADVRDRLIAWVETEGLSVPATARLMLILSDRDKIRVADAEAEARTDERERIAQAIKDLPTCYVHGEGGGWLHAVRTHDAIAAVRGDA